MILPELPLTGWLKTLGEQHGENKDMLKLPSLEMELEFVEYNNMLLILLTHND
jgi:hypothetical protein